MLGCIWSNKLLRFGILSHNSLSNIVLTFQTIKNDPLSEEQQGRNLVDAAKKNNIKCFVWSTLPSSLAISGGKFKSQIYENKYKVDEYMRETGVPGPFFYTGNFFENAVLRGHVKVKQDGSGELEFHQPVILEDTECISHRTFEGY